MQILESYQPLQMLDYFEISQYLLQQKCYETSINSNHHNIYKELEFIKILPLNSGVFRILTSIYDEAVFRK